MNKRADILLVGQTPPPFHGQSVVTAMLFEHSWPDLEVERLRMAFSDDLESVGEASWLKVWRLLCLILRTWKIVLTRRPEILYYLPASPNMAPVIRDIVYLGAVRWFFPKTVFHYHAGGLDDFVRQQSSIGWIARSIYGGADCSIDVNVTQPPSGEFFKAKQNIVVMNGLDVGEASRQRPKKSVLRLLYLGLLCEPKGVMEMLSVASELKASGVECEFVMVGAWESSALEREFKSAADTQEVAGMFHFKGVLSGEKKWQAYADADIFLFPTHHPTETFGLVLIEAMAFGLPIVTNRWRGVPHVIGDSGCAVLCEPETPKETAAAITQLANDRKLRDEMGRAGKYRYKEQFTKAQFVSKMAAAFGEILAAD